MSQESAAEKTEEATPRRLREQREKGQVPRSRELGTFTVTVASVIAMAAAGPSMVDAVRSDLQQALRFDADSLRHNAELGTALGQGLWLGLGWMAPLLLACVLGAVIGGLAVGGWNFSTKSWVPDFSRLNPLAGFKRMVSWQGLSELLKGLAKFGLLGAMLALVLYTHRHEVLALGRVAWPAAPAMGGELILLTMGLLSGGLLLIAVLDAPFQMFQYKKRLRMTKQEVKEEFKESEGRPEVKQRIRAQQQQAAQRRIHKEVPSAAVVITNPRHFAVALRYEADNMAAPILVAKGTGPEAALIRKLAAEHGVPMVAAPPLARSLYRHVREEQIVPAALYLAVAQVLGYVYQLARMPDAELPLPQPEVPEDWRWTPAE